MKKQSSARREILQVYEHCPRRPYVELAVPSDALAVTAATFKTVSRDQGWASNSEQSFTWFEVALRRPQGRSDVGTIKVQYNRTANPQFFRASTRWDSRDSKPRVKSWLRTVQPGDVIQLVPRAHFRCWVNLVLEGIIEIEYEARTVDPRRHLGIPRTDCIYRPLLYVDRQIRVLVVRPGEHDASIQANFEYVSLSNPSDGGTDFHALSYYWGDSPEKVPISIEAAGVVASIGISQTLDRAIRRLRNPDVPLRIWIDAVCINQDDLGERAQQVSMMGSIYTHSETVHIWLDDHVLGLDQALRLIRDIHNCNRRVCAGGNQCKCSETKHTLSAEQLDKITQTTEWHSFGFMREVFNEHTKTEQFDVSATEAAGGEGDVHFSYFMQTFFHHPWFQRVWVIQEAVLSAKTVVYSVAEVIPWDELLMVNEMISSGQYAGEARWSVQTRDSMPVIWNALARPHGGGQANGKTEEQKLMPILEVFLKALDLKATDPRDKLFALLAFGHETRVADGIPTLLRPDYNKPLEKVVADFTRWWILEYRSLDILSLVHSHPARAWRRTLCDNDPRADAVITRPSWTVAADGYAQLSHMTLREQFKSASEIETGTPDEDLVRSGDPLELTLRGRRIGEIAALDHPPRELVCPDIDGGDRSMLSTVFHRMFDPSAHKGVWLLQGVNYRDPEPEPAEARGILEDHVQAHFYYIPAPIQYTLLPAEGTNTGKSDHERYETEELPACIERCFFLCESGAYGLCPWTAMEGDVVTLLPGGSVPYLLREIPGEKGGGDGQRYQLVGECFVQGIGDLQMRDGVRESEIFVLV